MTNILVKELRFRQLQRGDHVKIPEEDDHHTVNQDEKPKLKPNF